MKELEGVNVKLKKKQIERKELEELIIKASKELQKKEEDIAELTIKNRSLEITCKETL